MRHEVLLTAGAEQDLKSIHDYIAAADSPERADYVIEQLLDCVTKLAHLPERGSYPQELAALGIREYRQTAFKPYRVIYRILDGKVVVYLIVDGRRDLQAVLSRRLLGRY